MRISVDGGRRGEDVVRSARPQIFFKRQAGMIRQLAAWDLHGLGDAGSALGAATLQMRGEPALAEAIALQLPPGAWRARHAPRVLSSAESRYGLLKSVRRAARRRQISSSCSSVL